jgi:hypothetical protein
MLVISVASLLDGSMSWVAVPATARSVTQSREVRSGPSYRDPGDLAKVTGFSTKPCRRWNARARSLPWLAVTMSSAAPEAVRTFVPDLGYWSGYPGSVAEEG